MSFDRECVGQFSEGPVKPQLERTTQSWNYTPVDGPIWPAVPHPALAGSRRARPSVFTTSAPANYVPRPLPLRLQPHRKQIRHLPRMRHADPRKTKTIPRRDRNEPQLELVQFANVPKSPAP